MSDSAVMVKMTFKYFMCELQHDLLLLFSSNCPTDRNRSSGLQASGSNYYYIVVNCTHCRGLRHRPNLHPTPPTVTSMTTLRFVHFNDVYHVGERQKEPCGGAARFATAVKNAQADAVFFRLVLLHMYIRVKPMIFFTTNVPMIIHILAAESSIGPHMYDQW